MKKYNTEYSISKDVNIYKIKNIIKNFYTNNSEGYMYQDTKFG